MLDQVSKYFYDPMVFWGAPLALALVWAGLRRGAHRVTSASPGHTRVQTTSRESEADEIVWRHPDL